MGLGGKVKFQELDIIDINCTIEGKWNEIFDFEIPAPLFDITRGHKHEFIFDNENPISCVAVKVAPVDSSYFFSFLFSMKEEFRGRKTWFQYIRGEVSNDLSVKMRIRNRDFGQLYSDPYEGLEKARKFQFRKKLKKTLTHLSSYYQD